MYKVLIIDDEEPAREAIKLLADWESANVYDVFEAWDGKSGIKLIEEKTPDIVFVDMNMPEVDGVELLKVINEKYPELAVIVISGYDKYEYTRQALQSKVIDYLLKPIKRNELNNAINKALNSIDTRRKKHSENIDKNILLNLSIPSLKEKIFLAAIEGSLSQHMKEVYSSSVNISHKNYYSAIIFRIMNFDIVNDNFFEDTGLTQFALLNIIDEVLNEKYESFSFVNHRIDNEIIVVISAEKPFDRIQQESYIQLIKSCKRKLKELFEIIALVSIGECFEDLERLKDSYMNAEKYINNANLFGNNDLIFNNMREGIASKNSLLNKKDLLFNALEGGSLSYTKDIVSVFLDKIENSQMLCLKDSDRIFKELLLLLNNFALMKGINTEDILSSYQNISNKIYSFEQLKTVMLEVTDTFYNRVRRQIRNNNFNIYEIKDYIENNYHQDIKISFFTDKYFLSREYLMKLFKNEFGCGIYEYVLKVRMEKAKELILDSSVKIQSIAQLLGYADNNYFSKAFKNYFGISPTDYRNNLIG